MKTLLLSALCALTINTSPTPAQADTTTMYFIDGKAVTNFDGSQLVGKTIRAYDIQLVAMNKKKGSTEDNSVMAMHIISTGNAPAAASGGEGKGRQIITLDGKSISNEELEKLDPATISSIKVYKSAQIVGNITKNGDDSIIVIETKEHKQKSDEFKEKFYLNLKARKQP